MVVGTSIFNNYTKEEIVDCLSAQKEYRCIRDQIGILDKMSVDDYAKQNNHNIERIRTVIKEDWLHGISQKRNKSKELVWKIDELEFNWNASAELTSIRKITEHLKDNLEVHLLATDTAISVMATEIIHEAINNCKIGNYSIKAFYDKDTYVIKGLQVKDRDDFVSKGMVNLVKTIESIASGYYDNCVLNITGGYKAVIPYLTIMGQVFGMPIYYIFEDTNSLIEIPQVPLDIKWKILDDYCEEFHRLEKENIGNRKNYNRDFLTAAEAFIERDDDYISLSPLGSIFWHKYKNEYFIYYCPDDVYREINNQPNIQRIIREKFSKPSLRKEKTEIKGPHFVFDDGDNPNRIFYHEHDEKIYIYRTFQNEEAAKKYIKTEPTFDVIRKNSKIRKIPIGGA